MFRPDIIGYHWRFVDLLSLFTCVNKSINCHFLAMFNSERAINRTSVLFKVWKRSLSDEEQEGAFIVAGWARVGLG